MVQFVLQLMELVPVVPGGWVKSATSECVRINCGDPTVQKFANVRIAIQKYVILGLENVFVNQDGMVIPVPDLVHFICMGKAVKTIVIARTTRSVRP